MIPRAVVRWLLAWAVATACLCALVHLAFALHEIPEGSRIVLASVWCQGNLLDRAIVDRVGAKTERLVAVLSAQPKATLVYESVVAESLVVPWPEEAVALSFVPGRDGVSALLRGRTAYLTPDDLLREQAYDKGVSFSSLQVTVGLNMPLALARLAERLDTTVADLRDHGRLHRIRVARIIAGDAPTPSATPQSLSPDAIRDSVLAAARFLARGVSGEGRFRYLVDAPTNRNLGGYDWPRHSGATYFLAQTAGLFGDPEIAYAALRAASYLRDHAMVTCGTHRCIGDDDVVDVGSSGLALVAFVEIARTELDPGYGLIVPELAAFLRSQQRPDGEFMHLYDRRANAPIDKQLLFYSGEAALALARTHALRGDPRDLDASARALAYLVGPGWRFFGSRYFWGEEHWTCQTMADLWARIPNRVALDFCLGWNAFNRALQYGPSDTPYDADGAFGFGPIVSPRFTPAGSRTEASIATLEIARKAHVDPAQVAALEDQSRRALALLLRQQLRPGPVHLFANPAAVEGAFPATGVDLSLRIDYAQHAGSAMLRWLSLQ
jgi:hypothetical protein